MRAQHDVNNVVYYGNGEGCIIVYRKNGSELRTSLANLFHLPGNHLWPPPAVFLH
jgi:hypothetical protein